MLRITLATQMPLETPNFLTPSGLANEEDLDALKKWLAGDLSEDTELDSNSTDLLMAIKAAVDHISMDLLIHADSLVRQATTDEYGPMEIEDGDKVFRSGGRFDWEAIPMKPLVDAEQKVLVNLMESARDDIVWLKKQIRRLESLMEQAKERKAKGYETALKFVADVRPSQ